MDNWSQCGHCTDLAWSMAEEEYKVKSQISFHMLVWHILSKREINTRTCFKKPSYYQWYSGLNQDGLKLVNLIKSMFFSSCVQDTDTIANGYIINNQADIGTVCTSTKPFQVCIKTDSVEGAVGDQSEGMYLT